MREPLNHQRTTLGNWLYGETEDDSHRHKTTLFVEIAPQKSIFVLIFGASMAYIILIICGTMGSPNPVKINKVECGIHNNCTLFHHTLPTRNPMSTLNVQNLNGHIQICEHNNREAVKRSDVDSEINIKFHMQHDDEEAKKSVDIKLKYGIYESNHPLFYDYCKTFKQHAEPSIKERAEWGSSVSPVTRNATDLHKVSLKCKSYSPYLSDTEFLRKHDSRPYDEIIQKKDLTFSEYESRLIESGNDQQIQECSTNLIRYDKHDEMEFRMIIIHIDSEQELYDILNFQVVQREPNFILIKYKRVMSFIFLLCNIINLLIYSAKIYRLRYKEIGFLKKLIFANLFCLMLYNFLYSCDASESLLSRFIDNSINSMMMTLVLFLNLVLIDSQTMKMQVNLNPINALAGEKSFRTPAKQINSFFMPKAIVCLCIFITLCFLMYTHQERMFKHASKMNELEDSIEITSLFGGFDLTDLICLILFFIYSYMAVTSAYTAFSDTQRKLRKQ